MTDITKQTGIELDTQETAAKILNVPPRFLQLDRCNKRLIPYVKIGRFVRYRRADLIEYVNNNVIGGENQ